jgi:hypothetical protein
MLIWITYDVVANKVLFMNPVIHPRPLTQLTNRGRRKSSFLDVAAVASYNSGCPGNAIYDADEMCCKIINSIGP